MLFAVILKSGMSGAIVEEFSMSKCCVDNNGLTYVNSTAIVLEATTCSYRTCKGKHDY